MFGTASLKRESVGSELGVGPWLTALLVAKDQRGQGIGTALVEAIEQYGWSIGFETIYCSTDTPRSLLVLGAIW